MQYFFLKNRCEKSMSKYQILNKDKIQSGWDKDEDEVSHTSAGSDPVF